VKALRAEREAQARQQQQLAAGESMARMARDGTPLLKALEGVGGLPDVA